MDGKKTRENQELYVVKSNELIQKGRYNLTVQQQKLVLYAISKIKKGDSGDEWYELSIEEACAVMGLELDEGGTYYKRIKNDLKKLTNRLWVEFPNKSEWTVSWFEDVGIVPLSGTVYVKFHEKIIPYLFELVNRYTQYQLCEVLVLRNKYAIRLYEIIRSYMTQDELRKGTEKEITLSINELRGLLCTPQYELWNDINRFCIKPAIEEINKMSDIIRVEYEPYKTGGRSFSRIRFTISYPNQIEKFIAHEEQRRRL